MSKPTSTSLILAALGVVLVAMSSPNALAFGLFSGLTSLILAVWGLRTYRPVRAGRHRAEGSRHTAKIHASIPLASVYLASAVTLAALLLAGLTTNH